MKDISGLLKLVDAVMAIGELINKKLAVTKENCAGPEKIRQELFYSQISQAVAQLAFYSGQLASLHAQNRHQSAASIVCVEELVLNAECFCTWIGNHFPEQTVICQTVLYALERIAGSAGSSMYQ